MAPVHHRKAIPQHLVVQALQTVWADLLRRGLLPDEVDNYRQTHDWFPWLKTRPVFDTIRNLVQSTLTLPATDRSPQLMVQFPDGWDGKLTPHVDKTPAGTPYRTIVGVALTHQSERNGGLHWWDQLGHHQVTPALSPGDLLEMPGRLPHASGGNHEGMPRVTLYLRW